MIIVHLNNKLIHFSQKSPYLSMSACSYLLISRYKNTNRTFHISIELLLIFLIQESSSLTFSQQYFQVLLNKDENLKCLKSETKRKWKTTIYIDVIACILKIHSFLLFAGYNRTTKVRIT